MSSSAAIAGMRGAPYFEDVQALGRGVALSALGVMLAQTVRVDEVCVLENRVGRPSLRIAPSLAQAAGALLAIALRADPRRAGARRAM